MYLNSASWHSSPKRCFICEIVSAISSLFKAYLWAWNALGLLATCKQMNLLLWQSMCSRTVQLYRWRYSGWPDCPKTLDCERDEKWLIPQSKHLHQKESTNDDNVTRVVSVSGSLTCLCNFISALPRRGCLLSPQSVGRPSADVVSTIVLFYTCHFTSYAVGHKAVSSEMLKLWNPNEKSLISQRRIIGQAICEYPWVPPNPSGTTWLIPGSGSTEFLAGSFSTRPILEMSPLKNLALKIKDDNNLHESWTMNIRKSCFIYQYDGYRGTPWKHEEDMNTSPVGCLWSR